MPKKTLIVLVVIGIIIVIAVLSIVLPKLEVKEPRVIKIGMLGPLTGGAAEYGIEARNGAQLAISQLNGKQTLYRYELVSKDDQADSALAEKGARELVVDQQILAVIGGITSPCTLAAGDIFQGTGLLAVSPSATSPKVSELGDFIFRVCPSDTFQGKSLAEFVVQELGFHRIAIFWDLENATYSGDLARAFANRAEELGAVITEKISYRAGQKEFTSYLEQLRATGPEALFIPGYYTEAALIAQQTRMIGWEIPIVGGDGLHSSDLIKIGGKAVDGVKFTSFFISTDSDPQVREFAQVYERMFGKEPGWVAAHGCDTMNIIAQAIKKEGPSREGIQKGLSEIEDFEGVTGLITFDENGDVVKDILKLEVREGKFQVWTP